MKGWKTIAFGILVAVLGALSSADMQSWVLENFEWTTGGLGTIIVILRALTTSSIFKKEA
ncbi:hypothetical protein LCGC14_1903260 [marine sediment metagenome]|uniref:Uncharacterized protein n=1 Tax=marine sediment metagenome TaxID=412755 RepID=A0A0F9GJ72_9ZZZZ